jgi:hypothetical protein
MNTDRHFWDNSSEILNDLWECRKERDRWRMLAEGLAKRLSYQVKECKRLGYSQTCRCTEGCAVLDEFIEPPLGGDDEEQ